MKLYIKFDINVACRVILEEQLHKYGIKYQMLDFGEIEIQDNINDSLFKELQDSLGIYSIEILNNQKSQLIQKIKNTIIDLVHEEKKTNLTYSAYLAEQLNLSYGYISNIFSEYTYTSIENYIIIQKIERSKKLIIEDGLTLTEISYKLNYSSVAHLSAQFKKVTGLTPSLFKRIIDKRRSLVSQQ